MAESVNGLETGLACLAAVGGLGAHLLWVETSRGRPSARQAVMIGGLYGLLILCRLDLGLWVAVLGARWLWLALARSDRVASLWTLLLSTSVGLLVVFPWFAFVHYQTGGFLPESGEATRTISLAYGTKPGREDTTYVDLEDPPMAFFVSQVLATSRETLTRPTLWPVSVITTVLREAAGVPRTSGGLAAVGGILAFAWLAWRAWRRAYDPSRRAVVASATRTFAQTGHVVGPLVLGGSILFIAAYSFFIFGSWWFGRYYTPMMALWVLYSALPVQRGLDVVGRRIGHHWSRAATALLLACAITWAITCREATLGPLNPTDPYWRMAEIVDRTMPPGTRLGAFQSGTLGWASRHVVINLDGVVNREASRAIRQGRVLQYAVEQGVDCILDWPWVLRDLLDRRSQPDPGIRLRTVGRSYMEVRCIERVATPHPGQPPLTPNENRIQK